jgi:NodT family efflux transporter outer membrane factor (OMF) lipoprotein
MKRWLIIAAACAPLLAACATDTPRTPSLTLPPAFEAPSRGAALPAGTLDQWWLLYQDPQLTALVEEALGRSFDVRTAASRLEQARAVRQGALAQYNPQGNLGASASRTNTEILDGAPTTSITAGGFDPSTFVEEGERDSASANFNVSWELDLFGRRAAARRSAEADLRTAEFTYEATRAALAANVADSLFQARGLAIQLAEAREALRVQEELFRVANTKAEFGLTPSSDAAQTNANVQSSRAQVEALDAQLTAARRSLLLLVGRGVDPLASLQTPASIGALPPVPAAIPGELLARRPDIREAEWRLASQAGRLTLSQRAFFPTFTLQPGLGLSTSDGVTSGSWTLGVGASVPVLDIPRLRAELRAQRAVSEQAVLDYERAVQTAYGEAENAFVYLDSDQRRVRYLQAAERSAASAYESKRVGYSRGFNDLQTALTAETAWRQARQALAEAQITLMQRSVQVFKALGGGWSPAAPGATADSVRETSGKTAG